MNMQLALTWGETFVAVSFVMVCLLLIVVILLQKGRGGGLSGALGGGGGSGSAFGAKTGDVFTWITVTLAGMYLLLAVGGNYMFDMSAIAKQPAAPTVAPAPTEDADSATTTIVIPSEDSKAVIKLLGEEDLPPAEETQENEKPSGEPESTTKPDNGTGE